MSNERIMRLRGTLARIADGRGPAPQMAEEALRQDDPLDDADYYAARAASQEPLVWQGDPLGLHLPEEVMEPYVRAVAGLAQERPQPLRDTLERWAESFLAGLSFNEPTLQRAKWARRRAPNVAESILAAIAERQKRSVSTTALVEERPPIDVERQLLRYGRHEEGCPEEHNDPRRGTHANAGGPTLWLASPGRWGSHEPRTIHGSGPRRR